MRAEFLWEVFTDTGAPEAYLLFKDAGRAQQSVREAEYGLPDDAGGLSSGQPNIRKRTAS